MVIGEHQGPLKKKKSFDVPKDEDGKQKRSAWYRYLRRRSVTRSAKFVEFSE